MDIGCISTKNNITLLQKHHRMEHKVLFFFFRLKRMQICTIREEGRGKEHEQTNNNNKKSDFINSRKAQKERRLLWFTSTLFNHSYYIPLACAGSSPPLLRLLRWGLTAEKSALGPRQEKIPSFVLPWPGFQSVHQKQRPRRGTASETVVSRGGSLSASWHQILWWWRVCQSSPCYPEGNINL